MPNQVDSFLTVVLPTDRLESWLAAVEGPARWALPNSDHGQQPGGMPPAHHGGNGTGHPAQSAHQKLAYEAATQGGPAHEQAWIRLCARAAGHDWPDWMPVGAQDRAWMRQGRAIPPMPRVAFSLPHLLPVTPDAFARGHALPLDAEGFMEPEQGLGHALYAGRRALLRDLVGTDWVPERVEQDVAPHPTARGMHVVSTRWRTGNSPIFGHTLARGLVPLCAAHGAAAAMVWLEEDRMSGASAFDGTRHDDVDHPRDSFVAYSDTFEEDGFWNWEMDALHASVQAFVQATLATDVFDAVSLLH